MNSLKSFCVTLLMLAAILNVHAQTTRNESKLLVHYDSATRLYGYTDSKGQLAIPHKYVKAHPFYEGLAVVRIKSSLWGYINEQDSVVMPFQYYGGDFMSDSSMDGLFLVYLNGYNGYGPYLINKNRQLFDEGQQRPMEYINGLAKIRRTSGPVSEFGFVNQQGELKIPVKFKGATDFSEGLAAVLIDSAWGYIDTLGQVTIKPRFNSAESFSHGKAVVGMIKKTQNHKITQDNNQDEVDWCQWYTKPARSGAFYEYESFNQNCALCADCFVGIINKKGDFVINAKYKTALILQPDLYKVGKGDCWGDLGAECYYGIINDKDEDLLKCNFQYSDIPYFTMDQKYFVVQKGFDDYTLKAIVDKNCNIVVPFKYYHIAFGPVIDEKNPITVGLVTSRGETEMQFQYVFMNLKQKQVIASGFEYASFFIDGVAQVSKGGKQYCIKSNGILLEYCDDCRCYR